MLMKEAVPILRDHCRQQGLDFNIADMRWGVRDEAQDDHNTTELCLKEILRCKRVSQGPYFVCFLGDKYGYRPYPNIIEATEYATLYQCAKDLGKDTKLIDDWYWLDTNPLPNQYHLQAISSKLVYYNDESEENAELREKDVDEWNAINSTFVTIFRDSADKAFEDGKISAETRHRYFQSVTENEVQVGLLTAENASNRTLYFSRKLNDINYSDTKAKRFQDLEGNEPEEEASVLLNDLKSNKLPATLGNSNMHHSAVNWTAKGVDESDPDHTKYLLEVRDFFIQEIKRMVGLHIMGHKKKFYGPSRKLFYEIVHQSQIANSNCRVFFGRKELVEEIKAKIMNEYGTELRKQEQNTPEKCSDQTKQEIPDGVDEEQKAVKEFLHKSGVKYAIENTPLNMDTDYKLKAMQHQHLGRYTKPLVIHGESGSGKTALMAYVSSQIDSWVAPNISVKVLRFLGTSPDSIMIRDVMVSMISQILLNYDIQPQFDVDNMQQDFIFLVLYFRKLLTMIDTTTKPLFIIIDSIDQLHTHNNAHTLSWLPTKLPIGVYLIISTAPTLFNCLKNAHSTIGDESRFIKMPAMEITTGEKILKKWSEVNDRTYTKVQWETVILSFAACPQPLFLMLAAYESLLWKSYDSVTQCILGHTIISAVNVLFDRLEAKHGKILVEKALGYMTASKEGLSDQEMEDILSLDDEVLQDTYIYHLPPDETNIRLAPSLWRRIQLDLMKFVSVRQKNNKDMITWHHRQFVEAATTRYLHQNSVKAIHCALVQYFAGYWADKIKQLELYKKKKGSYPNANRGVPAQPLRYSNNKFNHRRIEELPVHLIHAGMFTEFVDRICRDLEWLHTKCKACSLTDILVDLDLALGVLEECDIEGRQKFKDEISTLRSCLVLATDAINKDADNLAIQLLGQFPPGECDNLSEGLTALQTQAVEWVKTTKTSLLVPKTQCLPPPGTELIASIDITIQIASEADEHELKFSLSQDDQFLYVVDHMSTSGDVLKIYDIQNHAEILQQQHMPDKDFKSIQLVGNDNFLHCEVYTERDKYNPKFTRTILTPKFTEVPYLPGQAEVFCVSSDGTLSFLQAEDDNGKYSAIFDMKACEEQCRLKHDGDFLAYNHALFSYDATQLVAISADTITVWEFNTGKACHTLEKDEEHSTFSNYKDLSRSFLALPNNKFLGRGMGYKESKNIKIWDLKTGAVVHELVGHDYTPDIISLSRSYKRAVSGTKDSVSSSNCGPKYFRLWDLEEGIEIAHSSCEDPCGYSMLNFLGPHEDYIAMSTRLHTRSELWYLQGSELLPVYEILGHNERLVFAQLAHSQGRLLTSCVDNTLKIWCMDKITAKTNSLLGRCQTRDDIEKEFAKRKEHPTVAGEGRMETTSFDVSVDGKSAAVGTADGWILFYDLSTNKITNQQKPDGKAVTNTLATSNAKYFVSAGENVYVWDASSGEQVHELVGPTVHDRSAQCSDLAESCDRLVVAYGGMECYGDIYDLDTGTKLKSLPGLYGFSKVAITTDAKKIVTTFFEMPVIYNVETGATSLDIKNTDSMMSSCTFIVISPGDKYVVGGSTDGSVRVLEVATERYAFRFQHRSTVSRGEFTHDSSQLVTSGFNTLLIWCLSKGVLLHTLSRHQDFVMDMQFTCSGRFLLTCSKDKQILIWDFDQRRTVTSFFGNCAIKRFSVAHDMSSIIYCPENVAYLGILQPNPALEEQISGLRKVEVPEYLAKAQAMAMVFSPIKRSKTCSVQ